MDISRQFSIVRRWLPLFVVVVIAAGAASFGFSSLQPKVYQSTATLIVGESLSGVNPDYNQLLVSQRLSSTYAAIATTHEIMDGVVRDLGLKDSPDSVAGRILVNAATDTSLLTITARDADANTAAAIANGVAKGLIAASPAVRGAAADIITSVEQDLQAVRDDIASTQRQIQSLLAQTGRTPADEARLQGLQGRLVSLRSTYATLITFTTNATANVLAVVQPALPPSGPIGPRPLYDALLAATLALLFISALVFVFEYLDDAIRDPEEVAATLGLPTLASIATMPGGRGRRYFYRLAVLLYPRSPTAEAYRTLRANLEFASVDTPLRSVLVASAVPGEGKTVTAANLAIVVAQAGHRTLLVDADLRRPGVHEIFKLSNTHGLTDLIRNPKTNPANVVQATEQPGLHLLTTGPLPPNPTEIIASQRTRALIESLSASYDMVICDSPPVQMFADALVLSSYLDGTLLVVEPRRGRRTQLRHTVDGLQRAGATIVGVVLNRTAAQQHPEYGSYYQGPVVATSDGSASSQAARADGATSSFESR